MTASSNPPATAPRPVPAGKGTSGRASGADKKAERAERQGAALRANLHRRKDQARRRADEEAPAPAKPTGKDT